MVTDDENMAEALDFLKAKFPKCAVLFAITPLAPHENIDIRVCYNMDFESARHVVEAIHNRFRTN